MSLQMRVTMLRTRRGQAGADLVAGQTYTIDRAFGLSLVGQGFALDTDDVRLLQQPNINTIRSTLPEVKRLAAASELTPAATYQVGTTRFRALAADVLAPEPLTAPGNLSGVVYDTAGRAIAWSVDGVAYSAAYTASSITIAGADGYFRQVSLDPQGRIDASNLLET